MTAAAGRRFGLTVGGAFLALAGLAWWRGRQPGAEWAAAIGGLLLLGGLLLPAQLGPVFRAWMGLAHLLARITTPLFLSVVYYFVVTPVGLVRRLCAGSPHPGSGSTRWIPRAPDARRRVDMQRPF